MGTLYNRIFEMAFWDIKRPGGFTPDNVRTDACNGFPHLKGDEVLILNELLEVLGQAPGIFGIHIHDDGGANVGNGINLFDAELA